MVLPAGLGPLPAGACLLASSHSLNDARGAPEVVCPVVPHHVPHTHRAIAATCGNTLR